MNMFTKCSFNHSAAGYCWISTFFVVHKIVRTQVTC